MLKRVLAEITCGRQIDVTRLAKRLGVSESLVRQMLEALVRMGYLRLMSQSCTPPCNHCPIRQRCSASWAVTPKGRKVIKQGFKLPGPYRHK